MKRSPLKRGVQVCISMLLLVFVGMTVATIIHKDEHPLQESLRSTNLVDGEEVAQTSDATQDMQGVRAPVGCFVTVFDDVTGANITESATIRFVGAEAGEWTGTGGVLPCDGRYLIAVEHPGYLPNVSVGDVRGQHEVRLTATGTLSVTATGADFKTLPLQIALHAERIDEEYNEMLPQTEVRALQAQHYWGMIASLHLGEIRGYARRYMIESLEGVPAMLLLQMEKSSDDGAVRWENIPPGEYFIEVKSHTIKPSEAPNGYAARSSEGVVLNGGHSARESVPLRVNSGAITTCAIECVEPSSLEFDVDPRMSQLTGDSASWFHISVCGVTRPQKGLWSSDAEIVLKTKDSHAQVERVLPGDKSIAIASYGPNAMVMAVAAVPGLRPGERRNVGVVRIEESRVAVSLLIVDESGSELSYQSLFGPSDALFELSVDAGRMGDYPASMARARNIRLDRPFEVYGLPSGRQQIALRGPVQGRAQEGFEIIGVEPTSLDWDGESAIQFSLRVREARAARVTKVSCIDWPWATCTFQGYSVSSASSVWTPLQARVDEAEEMGVIELVGGSEGDTIEARWSDEASGAQYLLYFTMDSHSEGLLQRATRGANVVICLEGDSLGSATETISIEICAVNNGASEWIVKPRPIRMRKTEGLGWRSDVTVLPRGALIRVVGGASSEAVVPDVDSEKPFEINLD